MHIQAHGIVLGLRRAVKKRKGVCFRRQLLTRKAAIGQDVSLGPVSGFSGASLCDAQSCRSHIQRAIQALSAEFFFWIFGCGF